MPGGLPLQATAAGAYTMVDGDIVRVHRAYGILTFSSTTMLTSFPFIALVMLFEAQGDTSNLAGTMLAIVDSERSFARACSEVGIRASFLKFFDDDAIAFFPHPVKYKAEVSGRPAPDPHATVLQWEPQAGDVAASGDIGYTTGPSARTDNTSENTPVTYGQFFSIWKKQSDGSWKVIVDIGTSCPTAPSPFGLPFKRIGRGGVRQEGGLDFSTQNEAMGLDEQLTVTSTSKSVVHAYGQYLDEHTRIHREGMIPLVGVGPVREYLTKLTMIPQWIPISGGVSAAHDVAYSYGRYVLVAPGPGRDEHGFYLHVWQRAGTGEWRLAVEITNASADE